jgi:NAD(P)H dehydrogenase (quinone)
MKVLTVFAHSGTESFCHSVLERFDAGLRDAGHENEIDDLYRNGFDPVLRERDAPDWIDESMPDEILDRRNLRDSMLRGARGPLARFAVKRMLRGLDDRGIIRLLRDRFRPDDVLAEQRKVASAQALAFIAPVYFVGFPAMLKGWVERVFTLGFAFGLTADGWRGDIRGRIPLLRHEKALVIQTTLFDEAAYREGLGDAMRLLLDEFGLRFPGVKEVRRVFFHAVYGADDAARRGYLEQAYRLGREF